MLDVAIIGAGPCGLALARALKAGGMDLAVFEARDRLGGRVLTATSKQTGLALDLGPTWFWPSTQPRMSALVDELGLTAFPQHDTGEVLNLLDYDQRPAVHYRPDLHDGAHRIEGGMAKLIEALAGSLPEDSIRLRHELVEVADRGDHVRLRFNQAEQVVEVCARKAILAIPPRLVEALVEFVPPLSAQMQAALGETPTWMAGQAKALMAYPRAFWRERGHSGNAFVHHQHAVLGEIFDACDSDGEHAALGGFFSLPAKFRESLREGMDMLVSSQLAQVFGAEGAEGELHVQDWARERYTCTLADRMPMEHPPAEGPALLRQPQWGGKLHFGGSETAGYGSGHLEGALEAAARIQRALLHAPSVSAATLSDVDREQLRCFGDWVLEQQTVAFECYRQSLRQGLARQLKQPLTRWAVLDAMEQTYGDALGMLSGLDFDFTETSVERGRSALTPEVLAYFSGFNKSLLDRAIAHNRGAYALAGHPDEQRMPPNYVDTISRDLAAAWREFALNVNAVLLTKTGGQAVV